MGQSTKNVIVTGAAGGMGAAVVRKLVARSVNVVAVDRNPENLARLKKEFDGPGGAVETVVADVGSAPDVEGFVKHAVTQFGGLDGLFNIAGILGKFVPIADASNDDYDEVMRVNAKSVWLGMKYAIPALIARGGGAIVNTGSYLSWHGGELLGPYIASKHALVGLTKTAALENARHKIRVHLLCPGSIDTQMNIDTADGISPNDRNSGLRMLETFTATGKVADPIDVATVGVFLLLDAPLQMTGTLIPIDGGGAAR